jgi:hypothetical protein
MLPRENIVDRGRSEPRLQWKVWTRNLLVQNPTLRTHYTTMIPTWTNAHQKDIMFFWSKWNLTNELKQPLYIRSIDHLGSLFSTKGVFSLYPRCAIPNDLITLTRYFHQQYTSVSIYSTSLMRLVNYILAQLEGGMLEDKWQIDGKKPRTKSRGAY